MVHEKESGRQTISNSHVEENRRFVQNALEMVLSLGDFQKEIHNRASHKTLFLEADTRIKKLIPFETTAFYTIDLNTSDLVLCVCRPSGSESLVEQQVDFLIDKGFMAWAIRERRGVTILSEDRKQEIFLHVIGTYSRIRGMFVGVFPESRPSVPDSSYELLCIILRNTANAVESIEYCDLVNAQRMEIQRANTDLESKVRERTFELEQLNQELKNEIEGRKKAEREKTVLLREIHHRIKNNMQVVSSLLNLQADKNRDSDVIEAFHKTEVRVRSMNIVHEVLYQAENLSQIVFDQYMDTLVSHITNVYMHSRSYADVEILAEDVILKVDHAPSCGLIVTELVTNSIKYATPPASGLKIGITAQYDGFGNLVMTISDNGTQPPENLDPLNFETLGFRLVTEIISNRLEGTFTLDFKKGVCWTIQWSAGS